MLHIERLEKRFVRPLGDELTVLSGLDLSIPEHQIVSLVGTSGCGKSTVLRILSGLEQATSGTVRLNGEVVAAPRPEIGMVFQEPRLMPWLNVWENTRLAIRSLPKAEQDARIEDSLRVVGLLDFRDALPKALSGGMAQRAALARALVQEPEVLLLDEPFSALDAFTRMKLQEHLLEVWSRARFTAVFVTHDVDEALYLSDRVILLKGRPGRVEADLPVTAPRPRRRTDPVLLDLREKLLAALSAPPIVDRDDPPAKASPRSSLREA